jgi:hypothetical protein
MTAEHPYRRADRCPDCVTDAGAQLSALKAETAAQSKMLVEISDTVTNINVALIGDLQKQELIGRVDKQLSELKLDVDMLKAWREETKKGARDLAGRVVAYGLVAIGILVTAAYMFIKG